MAQQHRRAANRVLLLCSSIHDRTAWPIWKYLEMRQRRDRMMDIAILAFNTNGGSFEARVEGDQYSFKPYEQVHSFQQDLLERFVHRWHDPGRTYFVYGGHGMGDYMDLEQGVTSLPVHQLASILGSRTFEGMVFDSCFMSNLDCAYHLRHHTKYIGACEGYMWEPDHIPSRHIFNHRTAALMCNGGSSSSNETEREDDSTVGLGRGRPTPLRVLEQVQRRYCRQSPFADFSILDTTQVEDLRKFVHRYVIPRVYDRLTFYNPEQLKRLEEMGARSLQLCESLYHWNGSSASAENSGKLLQRVGVPSPLDIPKGTAGSTRGEGSGTGMNGKPLPRTSLSSPSPSLLSSHSRFRAEDRAVLMESVQLEHSLYPFNVEDKHLIDLKSYLIDMANEEAIERSGGYRSTRLCSPSAYSWMRNIVGSPSSGSKDGGSVRGSGGAGGRMPPMTSRTHNVHLHGTASSGASSSLWSSSSTTAPHSSSSSASLILEGSGRQGLQLLDQVVVKQQGPRAKPLYASRLGGISFTVHEFSPHSKPLVPWVLPAVKVSALKAKMKRFLKSGRLEEVHLPELPDAGVQEGKVRCISPRKKKKATSVKVTPPPSPSSTSPGSSSRKKCGALRDGGGTIKSHSGKCTKEEKRPTGVVKLQKPTPNVSVEKDMSPPSPLPSASTLPFSSSFSSSTPIQVVPTPHLSSSSSLLSFPREKVNVFQCR